MGWSIPEYPREKVNVAGNILRDTSGAKTFEKDAALLMINNWRTCHNFPLNTFQVRLRKKAKEVDGSSLVAQRIKRLASIKSKLERFPTMKLTQIQDIGGCRAIVGSVTQLDKLFEVYTHGSRGVKHKLASVDDYIKSPKCSGYRSIHLVYKYQSARSSSYKDLKIEIQMRTFLQHAWATAVETVGTFISQSLKSSQGEKEWLDFFVLMSSAMAMNESRPLVPNTPTDVNELRSNIIALERKLDVTGHLNTFRHSLHIFDERELPNAHYYLLELDIRKRQIHIMPFSQNDLQLASEKYLELESKNLDKSIDTVLVSAESLAALKIAFPNYYLDTDLFLQFVKQFIHGSSTAQLQLF